MQPFDEQLMTAAVWHAERGQPVFPLGRGSKLPAVTSPHPNGHPCRGECGKLGHGFHDASDDPAVVAGWWSGPFRGCNVGLATGYRSNLWVLDVDPKAGGDVSLAALVAERALPPAPFVGTPSGGRHYYYRRPAGPDGAWPCSRGLIGPGIDVRADGGYVVVPPSVIHNTGQYIEDAP